MTPQASESTQLLKTLIDQQAELLKERRSEKDGLVAWVEGLPIVVKVGTPIAAVLMWFQANIPTVKQVNDNAIQIEVIKSSFASLSQYREQQKQIDEIKESLAKSYRDMIDRMDKGNQSVLTEVKESNRAIVTDMKDYINTVLIDHPGRKR